VSRAKKQLKARRRRERVGHGVKPKPRRDFDPHDAALAILSYTISAEPIQLPQEANASLWDALGEDERAVIHAQVNNDPRRAIERLEPLLQRFPDAPMLLNWLSAAYTNLGDEDKAEELIRLNYQRNPGYLFARANYAQICLARDDLERVREIFKEGFDLKLLYPHRDVFHVTEFTAFAAVAVEYFVRTGEWKAAESLFGALEQIVPDHPATRQLRAVMVRSVFTRALDRLRRGFLRGGLAVKPARAGS
jgi:tetratricopeptide (TPR) repeat protein